MSDFKFSGKTYDYFIHSYNNTIRNERKVEISLGLAAFDILRCADKPIVEIGDVLPNYRDGCNHRVIDWYSDTGYNNLENVNIFDADLTGHNCISISTIEHFGRIEHGHDDLVGDSHPLLGLNKIMIECKKYFVTWGTGFNSRLDNYAITNPTCYLMVNKGGKWVQSDNADDYKTPYAAHLGSAAAFVIATNIGEILWEE